MQLNEQQVTSDLNKMREHLLVVHKEMQKLYNLFSEIVKNIEKEANRNG